MKTRYLSAICLALLAVAFCSLTATAQQPLSAQEIRGKQIYLQGTSPSGKDILAYVGDSSLEVPGNVMACANCHGIAGQGKVEGGINPSNVTWEALTKPYGVTHVNGRKHPAYTNRGLELAITRGVDPAGNKLLYAMPRYQLSKADLDDLVVYLKRLGTDLDPGVTENKIVIGTAFPTAGPLAELSQAARDVIAAAFAEVNSQGGVYSRQLELKSIATADNTKLTRADVDKLINDEKVFALAGVMIAGVEKEIVPLLAEREVPLIGPLTLDPKIGSPLNRQIFYVLDGSAGQARALISFMAKKPDSLKPLTIAVVHSGGDLAASAIEAVKDQSQKDKLTAPQVSDYVAGSFAAAEMVMRLKQANVTGVFFMGSSADLLSLMKEAASVNWFPQIFVQSGTASQTLFDAPAGFEGKVFCTFPSAPVDQTADAIMEFRRLGEKYKLPQKHLAAQVSAYSSAKILIEALKRVGKDLSRERLIQVLEGFYNYQTGLTPPITYGPNRRVGAAGAYVVMFDLKEKKFVPVSGWVGIN
ncbi:MAG TPA: ABC transporter substrate-binding protein [Pyrinomonadaceae bacterium]|nr:ABC transporter substrate-binding protein [Pyrinomonadaceae bacterium]